MTWPIALTIAGSDSSGGAGIQADLATFAVTGVFGASALTRVTAQNSRGVRSVTTLLPEMVQAQIAAVLDDLPVRAAKTGSLGSAEIIAAVAETLRAHGPGALVVDPVSIAKSGATLLDPAGMRAMTAELVPLATVLTPNVHEAAALVGREIRDRATAVDAARRLFDLMMAGWLPDRDRAVVITRVPDVRGAADLVCCTGGVEFLVNDAIPDAPTHGAGCVFSAAITAALAHQTPTIDAIAFAKRFVTEAIRSGLRLDAGRGPVSPSRAWSRARPPQPASVQREEHVHV